MLAEYTGDAIYFNYDDLVEGDAAKFYCVS